MNESDEFIITEEDIKTKRESAARFYYLPVEHLTRLILEERSRHKMVEATIDLLNEQRKFYREVFEMELNIDCVALPRKRAGFEWLLVIDKSLTVIEAWCKCAQRFKKTWHYLGQTTKVLFEFDEGVEWHNPLDEVVGQHERVVNEGSYAIHLKPVNDSEDRANSISAYDYKTEGLGSITLLERLVLELWYHWKTNKHLDSALHSFCTGSKSDDGKVPYVYWSEINKEFVLDVQKESDMSEMVMTRFVVH